MTGQTPSYKLQVLGYWIKIIRTAILFPSFYILHSFFVQAQEIKVNGKFGGDSVKIGSPIEFHLSAHYPSKLNLLFPDSAFSFAPFELQKKTYFPTKTQNGVSVDSVVYLLASYEVDSIQTLKLPVFVVNAMDCTQVFSNADSVFFQNMVKAMPDSLTAEKLPLKFNTNYLAVNWQVNYIIIGIAVVVLVIALILGWAFFGERVKTYFRLKKLMKAYESFRTQFDASVDRLNQEFSPKGAEQSLLIWKKYLESLLAKPYTKYTTREIRIAEQSEELGLTLAAIDRMIYGHQHGNVDKPFNNLKNYVQMQFEKKKQEVSSNASTPSVLKATTAPSSESKIGSTELTSADIENYASLLRDLPCPFCGRTDEKLNGTILHTAKSFIVLTSYERKPIIACPTTLNKKNNLAILSTLLLGWWGFPWGLIRTPQAIYLNLKEKKKIVSKEPNDVLLSFAFHYAQEIEANKDNKEMLKAIIRNKKSWWQS